MRRLWLISVIALALFVPLTTTYSQDSVVELPYPQGLVAYLYEGDCAEGGGAVRCPTGIAVYNPFTEAVLILTGVRMVETFTPMVWAHDFSFIIYRDVDGFYWHEIETQTRINIFPDYNFQEKPFTWFSLSPDDSVVAFANVNGLFVQELETGVREVLVEAEIFRQPLWSPDGSRIVFSVLHDDGWSIETIAPDGSNREQLVEDPNLVAWSDIFWSPDGDYLAFMTEIDDGEGRQMNVMDADGDNLRPAGNAYDDFGLYPTFGWATIDHYLLYRTVDIAFELNTLNLLNVDSGVQRILITTSNDDFIFYDVSPDGGQIVYSNRLGSESPLCFSSLLEIVEQCMDISPAPYLANPANINWGS